MAQASIFMSPKCQQWVTGIVFPSTFVSIPDLIIQPLTNNQVTTELPVKTAIVNINNSMCPLLFNNNMPNSIKLRSNQLITIAKHTLESIAISINLSIATDASDRDLTNHKPAALDKSLQPHTDKMNYNSF
uniref:Uncharacterized protein n=1 Tax=Romanomermis culicivorax TaxID=13658 RepID=A0A915IXF3_ROMCU